MAKKKLTPKQRVLKKYPKAYAYAFAGAVPWCVYSGEDYNRSLNTCDPTPQQAWAEAARRKQ